MRETCDKAVEGNRNAKRSETEINMNRDLLTNRWCIGGFGFLVVFAVLCHFWYQHDIASFQQQLSATDEIILQGDMSQKVPKNVQTDVPWTEPLGSVENRSESVEDISVPTEETIAKTDTYEKNIDLVADCLPLPLDLVRILKFPPIFRFRNDFGIMSHQSMSC